MTPSNKPLPSGPLQLEHLVRTTLRRDPKNARTHDRKQLAKLLASVSAFGFTVPIIIDEQNFVIAGHARLTVAEMHGIETVPCIRLSHLTPAQKRALAIADNRIAEQAGWDLEMLKLEFAALGNLEFPLELTGFETAEIDIIFDDRKDASQPSVDPADAVDEPDRNIAPTTELGDCWDLGKHRLLCGDALKRSSYETLLGDERAGMIITDPPYNLKINGHVSGLGKHRHREFAMASGEMSSAEFTEFLQAFMCHMVEFSADGSIHYIFMDWRHILEITQAGAKNYNELKALCVWNKTNGGMSSFYRSKHELIFVFKNGRAPHVNNFGLGTIRYRTNVWDHPGANSFSSTRDDDLAAHSTVKPQALIADAMRDCSKRGDIVLDPFAGSGTILLAAERTGRKAAAIELDEHYVDTAVRRWQQATGKAATLLADGGTFDEVAARRAQSPSAPTESLSRKEQSND